MAYFPNWFERFKTISNLSKLDAAHRFVPTVFVKPLSRPLIFVNKRNRDFSSLCTITKSKWCQVLRHLKTKTNQKMTQSLKDLTCAWFSNIVSMIYQRYISASIAWHFLIACIIMTSNLTYESQNSSIISYWLHLIYLKSMYCCS